MKINKKYTGQDLATAIFRHDICVNALGASLSGLFYGKLKVSLKSSFSDTSYTYSLEPGRAVINIGLGYACEVAGAMPIDSVIPEKDVYRMATLLKRAETAHAYHECLHLLLTDMDPKAYDSVPKEYVGFVKDVCNIVCDNSIEHLGATRTPYLKFMVKPLRWCERRTFVPLAKKYKDDGSAGAFLNYLLLFMRVGPHLIAQRNAMWDSLDQKELSKRLKLAYREPDPVFRHKNQISLAMWFVNELGIKPNLPQTTPERPIIILVDPQGKSQKQPLIPQKMPLPPISIVEVGDDDDGGDGILEQDATVIDMRKNKRQPKQEEGKDQGREEDGVGQDGSPDEAKNHGSAQRQDGKDGGEKEKGNDAQKGEGKDEGGDKSGSPSESTASDQESNSAAGESKGPSPQVGDGDQDWNVTADDEDPLGFDDCDSSIVDKEILCAINSDSVGGSAHLIKNTFLARREDVLREKFREATYQNNGLIVRLSSAIEELKFESGPSDLGGLEDGDDIDIDAYIDLSLSQSRSTAFFKKQVPGVEITDLAVSILVDCSASMGIVKSRCAYVACSIVAMACDSANVPTEISGFSNGDVVYVKNFEDDISEVPLGVGVLNKELFGNYVDGEDYIGWWGGTVCESATNIVVERLKLYEEKACKLLFVITDGETKNVDLMRQVVKDARENGIVVIGVGIGTSIESLRGCFGKCVGFSMSSLNHLPEYVADQIKEAIASPSFANK